MIFMYLYIGAGALLFVAIIVAMIAEIKVKSTYNKYKDVAVQKDITGQMLAEMIAQKEGLNVSVKQCKGVLSDHYNPADKSINISTPNFNQNSISALGVVAHEMGHAMQDKQGWGLYKVRQFVIKILLQKSYCHCLLLELSQTLCMWAELLGWHLFGLPLPFMDFQC